MRCTSFSRSVWAWRPESGRLATALLASMVFNAVNLALWKIRFGNIYVDQLHRTSALGLGDVLAGP